MSKRIWKWTLETTDLQTLKMPAYAKPLTVQVQGGKPQLWALVDPEAPLTPRRFAIYGTGNPLPDLAEGQERDYIGTYQLFAGELILHVFELVITD